MLAENHFQRNNPLYFSNQKSVPLFVISQIIERFLLTFPAGIEPTTSASELVNPVFTKNGDNVKVRVAVKFLDNQTKATLVSQYELVLHKDSNWKIVG